jgi:tetratricopeptide (TPR) repeat protein
MNDDASGYSAASEMLRQGRAIDAERILRKVLSSNPRHAPAHCDLGLALIQQKRIPDAVASFEKALAITPDLPPALEALGKLYGDTGRPADALRCLDRLLGLMPFSPVAHLYHSMRGWALVALGRPKEAAAAFETAVSRRPDFVGAWEILGVVYGQMGRSQEALRCFERLCALLPRYVPGHNYRGLALVQLHRYDEAIACFREALRLDPKFVASLVNMADPLSTLGRNEEALAAYEDARKIDPKNAQAELGRGDILQILGRINEAVAAYERAISLAPRWPVAYRHLLQVRTVTNENDPALKALEAMQADEAKLPEADAVELHLALSKAYRDLARPGPAFEHLSAGNRRKRRSVIYDEPVALAFLRAPVDVLTPEIMQAKAGLGDPSELPVFVLGMPRTGTTLVEQILASHTGVVGTGELPDLRRRIEPRFGLRLEKIGASLSGETLRQFGADYAAHLAAKAPGATRVVDKTMGNFCYAGLIHLALPKARIIHMVRDPMDTCFSCYSQLFMGTAPFANDLGELGRYYKVYTEVMAYWRRVLSPESMLEVRYEALVENFEAEARRLIAFCGLDWEDACLRFYNTKRAVRTASAVQVRQPLYKEAVGRWKLYAEWLGPLREALEL